MSDIKKHIGGFDRVLSRKLESGSPTRDIARLDHAGPMPRVFYQSDGATTVPAKSSKRGFWAAPPGQSNGVLFAVTDLGGVSGLQTIDPNYKMAGGTYVVGPLATDFNKTGLSADHYLDVWSVIKGKTYVNGQPFPSAENQLSVTDGALLFLRGSTGVALPPVFSYAPKKYAVLAPYSAFSRRFNGIGTITVKDGTTTINPPIPGGTAATDFYSFDSTSYPTSKGDLAPGWEWSFTTNTGTALVADAVNVEVLFKGARMNYPGTREMNVYPISMRELKFKSIDNSLTYRYAGDAYSSYYADPSVVNTTENVPLDVFHIEDLQLPNVCSLGHWTKGADVARVYRSRCPTVSGYTPPNGVLLSEDRYFNLSLTGGKLRADVLVSDPAHTVSAQISTHSLNDTQTAVTGLSFLGEFLPPTAHFTGSGRRGIFTGASHELIWGFTSDPMPYPLPSTIYLRQGCIAVYSGNPGTAPMSAFNYLAGGMFSEPLFEPTFMDNGETGFSTHSPHYAGTHAFAPATLVGWSTAPFAQNVRRVFLGTAGKSGYSSVGSALVSLPLVGKIAESSVELGYRYTSLSGTKYTYTDSFDLGMMGPSYGVAADISPWNPLAQTTGYNRQFFSFCTVNAADEANNQANFNLVGTKADAMILGRTLYCWYWSYNAFTRSSSGYSANKSSGELARYDLKTTEYIFLSRELEITLESEIFYDFGVGPSFDSNITNSADSSFKLKVVARYRGTTLGEWKIFDGKSPLAFNTRYAALTKGWDATKDPYYSHPQATVKEPVRSIFPQYSQQECCPFVAYTTDEEISAGAIPQCYIDLPLRLMTHHDFSEEMEGPQTEVKFVPVQLLANLCWMLSQEDDDPEQSGQTFAFFSTKIKAERIRAYYTGPTGAVKDALPPDLQAKYALNTVHFGRV